MQGRSGQPANAGAVPVGEATHRPKSLGEIVDGLGLTRTHYIALILVVLGGLFEVFEQFIITSLGPSLQEAFGISASQVGFLSTATLLAVVVGGVFGGFVADRFGRRQLLAISLFIYCFGSVLGAFASNYEFLAFSRVITGIGVGGEIAVGLTYLSELAPTRARGVFVALFNTVSAGCGTFLVYGYTLLVLGPVSEATGAGGDSWRWAVGLLGVPAVLVVFFRRYLPETPAHLLSRGDIDGTNKALTRLAQGKLRLRKGDEVVAYVDARTIAVSESGEHGSSGLRDMLAVFRLPWLKTTLTLGTTAFMAWGMVFGVTLLMPILLVQRGHSIAGSLTLTMVQNTGALVGALIATYGGHALPRRLTILVAAVGGILSVVAFVLFANGDVSVMVIGFLIQMCCYTVNTTIWLWAPEQYPTNIRAFGTAVVVNIGFVGGALLPLVVSAVFEGAGLTTAFLVVAAMYVVVGISALMARETQGRSLEELHGNH